MRRNHAFKARIGCYFKRKKTRKRSWKLKYDCGNRYSIEIIETKRTLPETGQMSSACQKSYIIAGQFLKPK